MYGRKSVENCLFRNTRNNRMNERNHEKSGNWNFNINFLPEISQPKKKKQTRGHGNGKYYEQNTQEEKKIIIWFELFPLFSVHQTYFFFALYPWWWNVGSVSLPQQSRSFSSFRFIVVFHNFTTMFPPILCVALSFHHVFVSHTWVEADAWNEEEKTGRWNRMNNEAERERKRKKKL